MGKNQVVCSSVWSVYSAVGFPSVSQGMTGSWNREQRANHAKFRREVPTDAVFYFWAPLAWIGRIGSDQLGLGAVYSGGSGQIGLDWVGFDPKGTEPVRFATTNGIFWIRCFA